MARNGRMDVTADYDANEGLTSAERAALVAMDAADHAYWQGRHLQAVVDGEPRALRNEWEVRVEAVEEYAQAAFRDVQWHLSSDHPAFGLPAGVELAKVRQLVAQAEDILTRLIAINYAPVGFRVTGVQA